VRSPERVSVRIAVPATLSDTVASPIVTVGTGGGGDNVAVAGAPVAASLPPEMPKEKLSDVVTVRMPIATDTDTVFDVSPGANVTEPEVAV